VAGFSVNLIAFQSLPSEGSLPMFGVPEKFMKTLFLLLILMTGSTLIPAQAQSPDYASSPISAIDTPGRSASDVVDMLAKKLSLTDDQKVKILPIIADRRQKIQDVRNDSTLRPRQRMRQVKGILADSDKTINALLTPEQQSTYAQLEQEMKAQAKARRGEGAATAN
jgi:periplasmic protein CpxP/Spy